MVPMGLSPPRKAAAMPLKPMAGTEDWVHCHCSNPVRNSMAAPMPASPPAMAIVRIRFFFSFMPQYFAANLLQPVAFSS